MVSVWVVRWGLDYEGSDIDSVHATKESAVKRINEMYEDKDRPFFDWVKYEEYEVVNESTS